MLKKQNPGLEIFVQPSEMRCFKDEEFLAEGVALMENLKGCDVLLGVKEVEIQKLIHGKTYLFFSHTAKEQSYNRELLQAILRRRITMIDYEYLTRKDKTRVVAFGRWAGIVGAYNGLRAFGMREKVFSLPPAYKLSGYTELKSQLDDLPLGKARIVVTGGGRVAHGALEILNAAGISEVSPLDYLSRKHDDPVYTRLDPWHYTRHIHNLDFRFDHFIEHPQEYENAFLPYARVSDMYMACHFWDPRSPVFLKKDDLAEEKMQIKVIADISCDIDGPIASTIRPSKITDPFYGYDPVSGKEAQEPFLDNVITVMAVDNLPGELPRDASMDFGKALQEYVMPSLVEKDDEEIIARATIATDGYLTDQFGYLDNFSKGL